MPADGFAFPVGVGSDENCAFTLRFFFQARQDFQPSRNNRILRLKILFNCYAELFLRQVNEVAHRRDHCKILA